ncbi:MAG: hypothetical protein AAB911_01445 [Patescibacteria group bacterium]
MKSLISKRYFLATAVSSLLSIFMVAVVAYGATMTISSTGLGSGTSTPGAIIGATGGIIAEDFVTASVFNATSTTGVSWFKGRVGIGTTTPSLTLNGDGGLAVEGGAIIGDFIYTSSFTATSTTATSTVRFGLQVATTSLFVDGNSGAVTIGTSTVPNSGDIGNTTVTPSFTVSGVGPAYQATGTAYVAGGGASGGEILLKSTDGNNCVSLMATTGALDPLTDTASTQDIAKLLSARVVACPR